jgi:uncharacterized Fe-S center protein
MAKVYFLDLRKGYKDSYLELFERLVTQTGGTNLIDKNQVCAVKTHFGEDGNINYVNPLYVRALFRIIEKFEGKAFLTDTTTLYSGRRSRADSHIELAKEHGFTFAPVLIADGMYGDDYVEVNGAKIARLFKYVRTVFCISHFKGHLNCGFGGALKNLGMGCASKGGKLDMHSGAKPYIDTKRCVQCLRCVEYCAYEAAQKRGDNVEIIEELCTGCGGCMSICPEKAIKFSWNAASTQLQKDIARYAAEVIRDKQIFYVNFLINISPNCDCFHTNDPMIAPDIGICASYDPVSIDQACYDMIKKPIDELHPHIDASDQLRFAEEYGAGERAYEIIVI